jgi:hypothetical protein
VNSTRLDAMYKASGGQPERVALPIIR